MVISDPNSKVDGVLYLVLKEGDGDIYVVQVDMGGGGSPLLFKDINQGLPILLSGKTQKPLHI